MDETTTVMAPLMTHTGHYHYLNDKVNIISSGAGGLDLLKSYVLDSSGVFSIVFTMKMQRCTVVKLPLSKQSYMLLVLPHEGASLQDVEAKLLTYMSGWQHRLQAG